MEEKDLYIHAACRIRNGFAWKGEERLPVSGGGAAFLQDLYQWLAPAYPKWYKMDRLAQTGVLAAEILLCDLEIPASMDPFAKAMVFQNSHSSLDADQRFVAQLSEIPSPAIFVYTLPNIVAGEISIRYGFKGEQVFFLSAKPDAEILFHYTKSLFSEGNTEFCVLGWIDYFQENADAVLFAVGGSWEKKGALKPFTKENLYQYFEYEQGDLN